MDSANFLSENQLNQVQACLRPGEVIRWVGCESRARRLRLHLLRLGFYLVLTVAATIMAGRMILMNPGFLQASLNGMLPVLTPIVLAGLGGVLLVREIIFPQKRRVDLYAITNRRALVLSSNHEIHLWSYGVDALSQLKIKRRRNGHGDILLEQDVQWTTDAEGRSTRQVRMVGFYGLSSVDQVLRHLEQIGQPYQVSNKES
jgi:hypothetical protein